MSEKNLTNEHTWDCIAESFDTTRRQPWTLCITFIDKLPHSTVIADLGCGNGRHLIPCAEQCEKVIGLDLSYNLLKIVKTKLVHQNLTNVLLVHGDLKDLPFQDDSLDAALCIAALHNIQGRSSRLQALKEIYRVLKPDGQALLSVWSRWQDRYRMHFLFELFKRKKVGEFGDIIIPWRQQNLDVQRFYHLYSKREIIRDIKNAGFILENVQSVALRSKKHPDNYFMTLTKRR